MIFDTDEKYIKYLLYNAINDSINGTLNKYNNNVVDCLKSDNGIEPIIFIKEKLYTYTLRLLISELSMISACENGDFVNTTETIAQIIADNEKMAYDDTNIKYSNQRPVSRELNSNTNLKKIFVKLNIQDSLTGNLKANYPIDLLSFDYLINDFNSKFSYHYFLNDINFLYKNDNHISEQVYLLSSDKYSSYLLNNLSKKRNIFNLCTNLKNTILSNDPRKSKNYSRVLESVGTNYNKHVKEINKLIKSTPSKYDRLLLKSQFNNFLFNDFFSSINSNLFAYLFDDVDLLYMLNIKSDINNLKSNDIFKIQNNLFNINFLKILMLFDINLNDLVNNTAYLGLDVFKNDIPHYPLSINQGYEILRYANDILYYFFDILWSYYTSVGSILNKIINEKYITSNSHVDHIDKLQNIIYSLLEDEPKIDSSFSTIDLSSISKDKNKCLLISYLFTSTIHQKAFYNLHFE